LPDFSNYRESPGTGVAKEDKRAQTETGSEFTNSSHLSSGGDSKEILLVEGLLD
jgi:hypothetical protein